MGHIINSRNLPDKTVVCKIVLDQKEIALLKGHMKNIHVISTNQFTTPANINTRGNKGVTKYFKIPLSIRSRRRHNGELEYQKLDTATKIFYVYTLGVKGPEEDDDEFEKEKKIEDKIIEEMVR